MDTTSPSPARQPKPSPELYRPCVGIMLVNREGLVFAGKRFDSRETMGSDGNWWQMPQGGVDPGEDLEPAALRELGEETGIAAQHLVIAGRMDDEVFYDLPPQLQGKLWKGRYIGQRQVWFLIRFTGDDSDIDIAAHQHPEFCEWQWVPADTLPDLIVPFKRAIYEQVVAAFRPLI